jgi:SAM-dependent methyltransferase
MIPLDPPDSAIAERWRAWEVLQRNGVTAYRTLPEFNLSIGARRDARAFRVFCQPADLVLDIGCGPQQLPSYHSAASRVVGIDPVFGERPRDFPFVQAIAEYLPFRDRAFDQILFASSLDHVLDPRRSLAEAKRCLKPGGRIDLWLDAQEFAASTVRPRRWPYLTLARKGWRALTRHPWLRVAGFRRTLSFLAAVARMPVPRGAQDCFHFQQWTASSLSPLLSDVKLVVQRRQELRNNDSVFMELGHS